MAFDLYVDKDTHDLIITKGEVITTKSKPELLRQMLSITLKTWVGEWFNNITMGGINRAILFRNGITKTEVDAWFRSIVSGFDEVLNIDSWDSTFDPLTREYDLTFVVKTDYGNVSVFVTSNPPEQNDNYTQVLPPSQQFPCEYDDLIDLSNRLHVAIHTDYPQD